jgi:hypothetical protein
MQPSEHKIQNLATLHPALYSCNPLLTTLLAPIPTLYVACSLRSPEGRADTVKEPS